MTTLLPNVWGKCSPCIYLVMLMILCCTDFSKGSSHNVSQFMESFHRFVTKLCPVSSICQADDSSIYTNEDSDAFRPCCTDCSCKPSCKTHGICCFESETQTTIPETDIPAELVSTDISECLYAKTGEPKNNDFLNFRSYNMFYQSFGSNSLKGIENCRTKKVAPWGSLNPVFSKQTRKIYMNEDCATADNVTDLIVWDAILTCESIDPQTSQETNFASFNSELENGVMPNYCSVQFKYPGSHADVQSQICFKDMIKRCTTTAFEVPMSINATKNEIREACESGLVSPYFGDKKYLYANVFCYICSTSSRYFLENKKCLNYGDGIKGQSGTNFVAMLNINTVKKSNLSSIKHMMQACPNKPKQNTSHCRPVLCPSGQIREDRGKCIFSTKAWYPNFYSAAIELRTDEEINIEQAFQWQNGTFECDLEPLSLPLSLELSPWYINRAYFKIVSSSHTSETTSLLVFMKRFFDKGPPEDITRNIGLLLKSEWQLQYKNKTLKLEPSPFILKTPVLKDRQMSSGRFQVNESFTVMSPSYRNFYNSYQLDPIGILATKLQFCEQIELSSEEFVLNDDRNVLYSKLGENYLFDAEFIIMSGGVARICLENSGFIKQIYTNSAEIVINRSGLELFMITLLTHFVFA